jgi:hypothetical protein
LAFLRLCLAACLFKDGPQLSAPANLDWDRFFRLLIENRLVGLFQKLGKSHPGLWPEPLAEQLRDGRYRLMLYGNWCEDQAKSVLVALREANIPAIVLKGWALVQILYAGGYSQRPSADMDLLVHPGDLPRVDRILGHLGYRDADVEPWPGYFQRYLNSRHYLSPQSEARPGRIFNFDIHWGIPDSPYFDQRTPLQPFFERSQPVKIADIEAGSLAMEDHLIFACSHIAHHGYMESLSAYYEIAAILLRAGQGLNWPAVFSRAAALRAVIPLQRVLARIEALWPGVIAPERLETLTEQKPAPVEGWVDDWVVKSKGKVKILGMLAWFTTPGVFRKLGYILETVVPGPAYLKKYYGPAPLGLWPLLYPWRLAVILLNRFG